MFSLIISKATNKIVKAHMNGSLGMAIPTPQEELEIHCNDNDLDPNDYFAIEYTWDLKNPISLGKHIYNPTTGMVELDPNYVPPAPSPAPTEPTA